VQPLQFLSIRGHPHPLSFERCPYLFTAQLRRRSIKQLLEQLIAQPVRNKQIIQARYLTGNFRNRGALVYLFRQSSQMLFDQFVNAVGYPIYGGGGGYIDSSSCSLDIDIFREAAIVSTNPKSCNLIFTILPAAIWTKNYLEFANIRSIDTICGHPTSFLVELATSLCNTD
jgi:hypothetical protein